MRITFRTQMKTALDSTLIFLLFAVDCVMLGGVLLTALILTNVTVKVKITSYREDPISRKLE